MGYGLPKETLGCETEIIEEGFFVDAE